MHAEKTDLAERLVTLAPVFARPRYGNAFVSCHATAIVVLDAGRRAQVFGELLGEVERFMRNSDYLPSREKNMIAVLSLLVDQEESDGDDVPTGRIPYPAWLVTMRQELLDHWIGTTSSPDAPRQAAIGSAIANDPDAAMLNKLHGGANALSALSDMFQGYEGRPVTVADVPRLLDYLETGGERSRR